jgi:site-specific DNA recombinase
MFVGGTPPFGYMLTKGQKLELDPERADLVREIFQRFPEVSAGQLVREFSARGCTTRRFITKSGRSRGGWPIYLNHILKIIRNPIYTGFIVHRGEWIKAEFEALVSREQWDLVQEIKLARFPHKRDPVRNFLLGILHDEHGRRMRIQGGTGRSRALRYYKSEHSGWARGGVTRRVMVNADRVEKLAISAVQMLLADRVQVKEAVMSLGLYSEDIRRLLKKGHLAARRTRHMDQLHLRSMFLALTPRVEVTPTELKLFVSCHELSRFLAWDGVGVFEKSVIRAPMMTADRVHVLHAPALLICGHPRFALPIDPCSAQHPEPNQRLVEILRQGAEFREFMLANRTRSISDLAREKDMGSTMFARFLRVNYLAPDIQAAIMDGTQPPGMGRWDMLWGPMPLNWEQQRQVMGFY